MTPIARIERIRRSLRQELQALEQILDQLGDLAEKRSGMARPKKCCAMGSYECQVPMPLNGRLHGIDFCIADIVAALNAANITTEMSCCGHGRVSCVICLTDGREITVVGHTP